MAAASVVSCCARAAQLATMTAWISPTVTGAVPLVEMPGSVPPPLDDVEVTDHSIVAVAVNVAGSPAIALEFR
jgi:hypothetical protein